MATVTKIQRNIIIGADAQKFYDAMRGINNQIAHVDQTLRKMEKAQMGNVAAGHLLSQAITMVGRAFVQYINDAVDSAQKLPKGLFEGVDALREARTESERIAEVMGVAMSNSWAKVTDKMNAFNTEFIGFMALWEKHGFFKAMNKATMGEDEALGKKILQNIADQLRIEEAIALVAADNLKDKKEAAEASKKEAEAAKKIAAARREERLELEGIKNLARNEISDMVFGQKKSNTGFNYEGEALLREAFDASEMADFNTEMARMAELSDISSERILQQKEAVAQLESGFWALGGAMASVWDTGNKAFDAFLGSLTALAAQIIAKNLAISMSNAIVGGTNAGAATGPAAPITMPAFIAGLMGVVGASFAGLTKMAHGGIVNKATPVLAGEAGPEAIIPLNQLNRMGGNLTARISGRDLLLLLEREQTVKARGYGN